GPGRITEWLGREGTHRTDVDHIARQFRLDGLADKRLNFRVLTTIEHAQFHDAGHFLTKTHATGTVNATAHFLGRYQRADILVEHHALFFAIAGFVAAVTHGQVLQLAFTALVADRAIERVIDQQKLHHAFLRSNRLGRAR